MSQIWENLVLAFNDMDRGSPWDPKQRPSGSNNPEQRGSGSRIPIHSLLTNSPEPEQQTPSSLSSLAPSSQSPGPPSTFTPLNSTYGQATAGQPSASPPIRSNPGSPVHHDVPANQPLTPSLVAADMQGRVPRAPRPSYSGEQKFFIMYARIMKDNTWPEIEDQFNVIFGTRTKGGLTSVYYRVRKDWGLMEVLKSGPDSFVADCKEVERRARNFSKEFLAQIGYPVD